MPIRPNDHSSASPPVTIYVRHPPAQGRDWIVSRASAPDQHFANDHDALRHALERAKADSAKGLPVEVRLEKADGSWQIVHPLPGAS
jgi:hypothetical protein